MDRHRDMADQKFQRKALQVQEAQARVMQYAKLLGTEEVPLSQCCGRVLAEPLRAPHPFPAFNRSGMDGYALRAADTMSCNADEPVWLEVIDNIPCGAVASAEITKGTAARIMTGAQVPEGADTVVMIEITESRESDGKTYVGLRKPQQPGSNITPAGFELQEGELMLPAGRTIAAGDIAVLAAFGFPVVKVQRRPKVAIFATGTELLEVDEPLQPGKIRNSNSPMLEALVREAGGEPVMLGAIADDLELARSRVQMALETHDLVITTGGVSVGDYDIMGDLVREKSSEMLFNKVTMRPGSVTTAAVRGGKLLLALSGNPGASFVGFHLFARPVISLMLGTNQPLLPEWSAVMGADYSRVNNYTRFVRARLAIRDGMIHAYPAVIDESSVMVTIKDSDCLIVVPPEARGLKSGDKVKVLKLPGELRGQE
ncbi:MULTISPECIES: gephyrin-like molybdotransferase Glp [unclassified Paenibacillus]|uniref:molybdopterin molybdotransferase MoeA n=1 Tax=unclassified Paenibacillus TaxID=185978 RepID=UPI0024056C5A|nr:MULTISPECIES: gephyrin-like molybdotransferase Glp [unclassified Paenibacillus]MDF9841132.1 molybdopterin molybdotransferase [Paenibacillus sp. PastF-2]MDF9847696.1 molybdopterin molybdotransferase [Paenibacillus sp. PastM-2]MDF9854265.1 molybdopterin molybdotransferase [Paenibacillus sp. PastF-1]MDH6479564.1 molybdopterin molybdotransferase [Paenibacillus sp. PastH-2]MDH6505229.1 molybdopterin molybdotransferase [Paenibacillus sp. PastM-3]